MGKINIFLRHLLISYEHFLGKPLLSPNLQLEERLHRLDQLNYPVLSHGLGEDPIINYANKKALELWETTFDEFTKIPSRLTAEAPLQEVREQFLKDVRENGFTAGYEGVRVSRKGNRFTIKNAVVWNVLDSDGKQIGQAATFDSWEKL